MCPANSGDVIFRSVVESDGTPCFARLVGLCRSKVSEEDGLRRLLAGDLSRSPISRAGDLAESKSCLLFGVDESYNSSRSLSFGLLSGSNFEYCEVSRAPGEGSSVVLEVPGGKLRAEVEEEVGFTEDGSHRLKMLGKGGRGYPVWELKIGGGIWPWGIGESAGMAILPEGLGDVGRGPGPPDSFFRFSPTEGGGGDQLRGPPLAPPAVPLLPLLRLLTPSTPPSERPFTWKTTY